MQNMNIESRLWNKNWQIEKNQTWELVPRLVNKNVIGIKWVFQNKLKQNGEVIRNKERLVCKGYSEVEGIYFKEIFTLMERMEAIKIFLAFPTQGFQISSNGCEV